MFRKPIKDRSTHWVVRQLLRANDRAAVRRQPSALLHPWAWVTRRWRTGFEAKSHEYLTELNYRFAGVINRYLRSKGITTKAELENARKDISMSFHVNTYKLAEAELFAPELWRAVQMRAGVSTDAALKRRFMLRQFVEDVRKGKGRDTLRRLGFERDPAAPKVNPHDLAIARAAYPSLHKALLKRGALLDVMTERAIEFEQVELFQPPYGQYDTWLFE
jgi:hypothetical protein